LQGRVGTLHPSARIANEQKEMKCSLRLEVMYVDEVHICELCQRAYEPKEINGVRKLKEYKGYTVDLRLQQFRKLEYGKLPQFIDFASPKGKKLLDQMHEAVTH